MQSRFVSLSLSLSLSLYLSIYLSIYLTLSLSTFLPHSQIAPLPLNETHIISPWVKPTCKQ